MVTNLCFKIAQNCAANRWAVHLWEPMRKLLDDAGLTIEDALVHSDAVDVKSLVELMIMVRAARCLQASSCAARGLAAPGPQNR